VNEIHQLLEGDEGGVSVALMMLFAAGFEHEVPKGYVYFAMAFSVGVELLNIRMRKRHSQPLRLHEAYVHDTDGKNERR